MGKGKQLKGPGEPADDGSEALLAPDTSMFATNPLIDMALVRQAIAVQLGPQAAIEIATLDELHALDQLLEGGPVTKEALIKAIEKYKNEIMTGTNVIAGLLRVIMLITRSFGQNTRDIFVPGENDSPVVSADGLNQATRYLTSAAGWLQKASGSLTEHQTRLAQRPAGSLVNLADLGDMVTAANTERVTSGPTTVVAESEVEAERLAAMARHTGVELSISRPKISVQAIEQALDALIEVLAAYNGSIRPAARGHLAAREIAAAATALERRSTIIAEEPAMAAHPDLMGKIQEVIARVPQILGELAIWLEHFIGPQHDILARKVAQLLALSTSAGTAPGAITASRGSVEREFLRNYAPSTTE